ncbi:hypothetical protein CVT24_010065 [Panaeolus cyanescens]|uniref:FAD-binding domain-containing protein n=1 Tax=Panaeolus cyanescens TaxID=181874 RepID=A0A409W9E2_9AGAR|nr:hypothetical protein CVT24_010065 [Panaeolus cyanescens]
MANAAALPVLIASSLFSDYCPSGLVLALALRKNGIPMRIIDKELKPRFGERGAGLSPRSIELHRLLGTGHDVLDAAKPLPWTRHYAPDGVTPVKTFQMVPQVEARVGIPNPNALMLGQHHHEAILRAHLEKMGTKVEFGAELTGFSQSEGAVTVEITHRDVNGAGKDVVETLDVTFLVGADGAHSFVRKALGLGFLGETRVGDTMVLGDVEVKGGPREYWEQWGGVSTGRVANLRPSGQDPHICTFLFAGTGFEPEKIHASREALTFLSLFYEISNRRDIEFGEVVWSAVYRNRPNIRMVDCMRVNRVFVLGDAAHCHTPAGGQGMNSGIQDSLNLGWKLALVYRGIAPLGLLDTFGEERLPVIAEMLHKTTEMFGHVMKTAGGERGGRGGDFSQLGVNYRNSSIVLSNHSNDAISTPVRTPSYNKESETAALPGDRAPDAPSLIDISDDSTTTLFGLLSPSFHTVFVFSSDQDHEYGGDGWSWRDVGEVIARQPGNTVRSVLVLRRGSNLKITGDSGTDEKRFFDCVVRDEEGCAFEGYKVAAREELIVIVRPDGVIGARTGAVEGIGRYFGKLFD